MLLYKLLIILSLIPSVFINNLPVGFNQQEIIHRIPVVSFDKSHNVFVNKIDHFSVLYPKTLRAVYLPKKHVAGFITARIEEDIPASIGITVSDTDLSSGYEWVRSENAKIKNQPLIKIIGHKKYKFGTMFYLKQQIQIDSDGEKPIYTNQDSAILIKDHKLYNFWMHIGWEDAKLKNDFFELVRSFHFL